MDKKYSLPYVIRPMPNVYWEFFCRDELIDHDSPLSQIIKFANV